MSIHQVASQFTGSTTLFGNSQAIQPSTKRSQMIPATSSTTSTSSSSGSSGDKSSDDGSSSYSFLGGKDGENSDSGSWSWSMESGSGSLSLEYECYCRSVRRVSLMGASDYCLAPSALPRSGKRLLFRHHGPESSMSMASPHLLWTARQVLAVVVCMAFGMIAVV
ncbi:unnamed protein product [Peronospora farinosa]|uniref:Uncharacterized protein n=1 Tax=Peronospora farinosa TaxID=134698 RepID=A0ABN8BXA0_9STRA|nr:unnamed protein product [Peronospora farinosa]